MENVKFRIHINVGGFRLPLEIPRSDEEVYRRAEKRLNAQLDKLHKKYSRHREQDILAIAAYHFAVALCRGEMSEDTSPILDKIEALSEELDKTLSDKEQFPV